MMYCSEEEKGELVDVNFFDEPKKLDDGGWFVAVGKDSVTGKLVRIILSDEAMDKLVEEEPNDPMA